MFEWVRGRETLRSWNEKDREREREKMRGIEPNALPQFNSLFAVSAMLKLDAEATAAAPFLQHDAAARAEPEGRATHAMAESRAAVAANFTMARASAEKSFFFSESTAMAVTAPSGRARISRGERRDPPLLLEEGGAAAAQRVDDDDEIDAIVKPLVGCLNIRVLVVVAASVVALLPLLWPAAAEEGLAETQQQRLLLIVIIAICSKRL